MSAYLTLYKQDVEVMSFSRNSDVFTEINENYNLNNFISLMERSRKTTFALAFISISL